SQHLVAEPAGCAGRDGEAAAADAHHLRWRTPALLRASARSHPGARAGSGGGGSHSGEVVRPQPGARDAALEERGGGDDAEGGRVAAGKTSHRKDAKDAKMREEKRVFFA